MSFSPYPNKHAQEVYFSRKMQKDDSQNLTFNVCNVGSSSLQKHLRLLMNTFRLEFDSIIKRLSTIFPRDALLTIYKSFIRPHQDYETKN